MSDTRYNSPHEVPPKIARLMSEEDRKKLKIRLPEEIAAQQEVEDERDLQNLCEAWLRQNGYWPRTPAFLSGGRPERGWYIHIHKAKANPYMLDILVLNNDGRYLEVELKTPEGRLSDEQAVIVDHHGGKLARSFDAFVSIMAQGGML